jgi:serine phosphatase RsbU (regulator of sigma subunit)
MAVSDPCNLDATTVFTVDRASRTTRPVRAGDWLHVLHVVGGPLAGQHCVLGEEPVFIGRDPGCGMPLSGSQVSRRHCSLSLHEGAVLLVDLGSTNGTYLGARRVESAVRLGDGSRFSVGEHTLRYERRERRQAEEALELDRSIVRAIEYVHALLPAPMHEGPVRADWVYEPCARLGGDAFGYFPLGSRHFVAFMIDVAGHGVAAAMHSVSILNVLRQRALPDVDFCEPSQVLRRLNAMFQMEQHDEMYFTMWYGVFDSATRELRYASAGHHPAYVVEPGSRHARPVHCPGPIVGMLPDHAFAEERTTLDPGARLCLFSDGVFEVVTDEGVPWTLGRFVSCLGLPATGVDSEPRRLYEHARAVSHDHGFDDDVSIVAIEFGVPADA